MRRSGENTARDAARVGEDTGPWDARPRLGGPTESRLEQRLRSSP